MPHFVIIGLGSIGRRHASNLAALRPDARFTIVRHQPVVDDFCRALDARVVDELAQVTDDIDLAVLATPSANHIDDLPVLIARGCPLLVEKPIVADVTHCDDITHALDDAPPAVRAVGFNLRHLPSIVAMKRHIESGALGRIARASLVAGQWLPDWRPDTDYRLGYSADARRGGGVELDLSHEFDMARWLFGELRVDFARGARFSDLEIDANDTCVSMLSPLVGGGPITTVSLDYVSRKAVRSYDIVGDRGSVHWNLGGPLEATTPGTRHPLPTEPSDFDMSTSYVHMMTATLRAVETGDDRFVQSLRDGLASTRLALSARDRGGRG